MTGDWSSSNMDFDIGANGGLALALVWLYFMCWSSYGIEVVATFAPEYHDTQRDTRMALRTRGAVLGARLRAAAARRWAARWARRRSPPTRR